MKTQGWIEVYVVGILKDITDEPHCVGPEEPKIATHTIFIP